MHCRPQMRRVDARRPKGPRKRRGRMARHAFSVAGRRKKCCRGTSQKYQAVSRFVRPGTAPNDSCPPRVGVQFFWETMMAKVLDQFRSNYSSTQAEEMSVEEFLDLCRDDP